MQRLPLLLLVVLVAIGALVYVLDGSDGSTGGTASPSPAATIGPPDPEIVATAAASGVLIEATGCLGDSVGSGAVLADGVVTNAHVIAGSTAVTVTTAEGDVHEAEVRAFDPLKDLALLVVPDLDLEALGYGAPVGGSEGVALVRQDGEIEIVPVEIARTITIFTSDIYGEGRHERKGMELRAEIDPGDSGAGVIDAQGEVVGIVFSSSRRTPGVGYAISAVELDELIASSANAAISTGECLR